MTDVFNWEKPVIPNVPEHLKRKPIRLSEEARHKKAVRNAIITVLVIAAIIIVGYLSTFDRLAEQALTSF
jgi:hypothetical protein